MIDKMISDYKPQTLNVIAQMSRKAIHKSKQLHDMVEQTNHPLKAQLKPWLVLAKSHFHLTCLWAVYEINQCSKNKTLDTPKSISTIYFEDKLLGEKLIQYQGEILKLAASFPADQHFNLKEAAQHSAALITNSFKQTLHE